MSIGTIILIILVIALLGGFSGIGGGPFYGTGYYGGGGLGLVIVILLILLLMGSCKVSATTFRLSARVINPRRAVIPYCWLPALTVAAAYWISASRSMTQWTQATRDFPASFLIAALIDAAASS